MASWRWCSYAGSKTKRYFDLAGGDAIAGELNLLDRHELNVGEDFVPGVELEQAAYPSAVCIEELRTDQVM
jgi:hypothetical protein